MCKNEKKKKPPKENYSHVTKRLATAASIRQCHAIMYARCEGHWEMLKNICCSLPQNFTSTKKKNCIHINATQVMHPCASFPLENSSSPSPHPLRVPHPISKSIICVCEAEEAHQFTATAPPPFFFLLPPPATPPSLLAATEPCSPPPPHPHPR